jgi:hypothetical protein
MPEVVSDSLNDFKKMLESCKLEGAYNDDLVFDNNGNTRTSWWALQSFFTWVEAWSSSTCRRAKSGCPGTFFSTFATGLRPALLMGRPGLENPGEGLRVL